MGSEIEWSTSWDWYGPELFNEGVPTTFRIVTDTYEKYSDTHGNSLGQEQEHTATLLSIKFGEAVLDRNMAILMYGYPAVEAAEDLASEKYMDKY